MDELLALLERYSPGYHRQIEEAYDWSLDELEEVFGQPLPDFYRKFARVMGTKGGPLLSHVHAYEPIEIADLYRLTSMEMPPRRFLYVFGDPSRLNPHHYWLDLEAPSEEGDRQVVRMPFGEDAWKRHLSRDFVSLREMLFVWAMENVHLPTFSHQAKYRSGDGSHTPKAEDLARIFERMSFARLPYPRHCLLFERDGAAIRLYRPANAPRISFQVGMRAPDELRRFQALIEDNTDMEKV